MNAEKYIILSQIPAKANLYNYKFSPSSGGDQLNNFTHENNNYEQIKFTTDSILKDNYYYIRYNNTITTNDLGIYKIVKLDNDKNYLAIRDIDKTLTNIFADYSKGANWIYMNAPRIAPNNSDYLINSMTNKFFDEYGIISTSQEIHTNTATYKKYNYIKYNSNNTWLNITNMPDNGCLYMYIERKTTLTGYIMLVASYDGITASSRGIIPLRFALEWIGTAAFTNEWNYRGFFPGPSVYATTYEFTDTVEIKFQSTTYTVPLININILNTFQTYYEPVIELPAGYMNCLSIYNPYLFNTAITYNMIDRVNGETGKVLNLIRFRVVFVNGFSAYADNIVIEFGDEIIFPSKNELAQAAYNAKQTYNTSMNALKNKNDLNVFNQQMEWKQKAGTLKGFGENLINAGLSSALQGFGSAITGGTIMQNNDFISLSNQKITSEKIKYRQDQAALASEKNNIDMTTKANFAIEMASMSIFPAGISQAGYDFIRWNGLNIGNCNYIRINRYTQQNNALWESIPQAFALSQQVAYDTIQNRYRSTLSYMQIANTHDSYGRHVERYKNTNFNLIGYNNYELIQRLYKLLTDGYWIYAN